LAKLYRTALTQTDRLTDMPAKAITAPAHLAICSRAVTGSIPQVKFNFNETKIICPSA